MDTNRDIPFCLLRFTSRFWFVTTAYQARKILEKVEKDPNSLKGSILIVDSLLRVSYKFWGLLVQNKKFGFIILLVSNYSTSLDKRVLRQVTHKTRLMSTEVRIEKEIR